jgi:hypothetical protein
MFGFGGRKTKTLFAQAYVLSYPTVSHKTRKDPLISRERVPEQQKKRWRTYVSGELGDEYKTPLSSFSSLLLLISSYYITSKVSLKTPTTQPHV